MEITGVRATITLTGPVSFTQSGALRDQLHALVAEGAIHDIFVNLYDVNFLDSTGLAAFVHGRNLCKNRRGNLVLITRRNSPLRRIVELADVALLIVDSLEDAHILLADRDERRARRAGEGRDAN